MDIIGGHAYIFVFAVMSARSKRGSGTRRGYWSRATQTLSLPSSSPSPEGGKWLLWTWLWLLWLAFQLHFSVKWAPQLFLYSSFKVCILNVLLPHSEDILLIMSSPCRCKQSSLIKSSWHTPKPELWQKRCSLLSEQCSPSVVRRKRLKGVYSTTATVNINNNKS